MTEPIEVIPGAYRPDVPVVDFESLTVGYTTASGEKATMTFEDLREAHGTVDRLMSALGKQGEHWVYKQMEPMIGRLEVAGWIWNGTSGGGTMGYKHPDFDIDTDLDERIVYIPTSWAGWVSS